MQKFISYISISRRNNRDNNVRKLGKILISLYIFYHEERCYGR